MKDEFLELVNNNIVITCQSFQTGAGFVRKTPPNFYSAAV